MRNGFDTQIGAVQNNYGYQLSFTCQDATGAVVDLTGATLAFACQLESDMSVTFTNPMDIVGAPTNGQCSYTVLATDFTIAGVYTAQIVASFTGEVISFPGITITVTAAIPVD